MLNNMLKECKRILLKYSGAALSGDSEFGLDMDTIDAHAKSIKQLHSRGTQIVLQVGGGNIFRGNSKSLNAIPRSAADHIGMLSTVINGIAVQNILEKNGLETRLMSAWAIGSICELYIRRRAVRHLEKGRVVVCCAGTGNPFFTTDTAAALRAAELDCDLILKGTFVDGVYSADPRVSKDSKYIAEISYQDVMTMNLKVMDTAAVALARDVKIPIVVFSMLNPNNLLGVFDGKAKYTIIK